jgi:hypothetical protein
MRDAGSLDVPAVAGVLARCSLHVLELLFAWITHSKAVVDALSRT